MGDSICRCHVLDHWRKTCVGFGRFSAAPAATSRVTPDMVSPVRIVLQRSQNNVRNALEQKHLASRARSWSIWATQSVSLNSSRPAQAHVLPSFAIERTVVDQSLNGCANPIDQRRLEDRLFSPPAARCRFHRAGHIEPGVELISRATAA